MVVVDYSTVHFMKQRLENGKSMQVENFQISDDKRGRCLNGKIIVTYRKECC